jgi:hypothetical protein
MWNGQTKAAIAKGPSRSGRKLELTTVNPPSFDFRRREDAMAGQVGAASELETDAEFEEEDEICAAQGKRIR